MKMWYIYTVEYYTAVKKNKTLQVDEWSYSRSSWGNLDPDASGMEF